MKIANQHQIDTFGGSKIIKTWQNIQIRKNCETCNERFGVAALTYKTADKTHATFICRDCYEKFCTTDTEEIFKEAVFKYHFHSGNQYHGANIFK